MDANLSKSNHTKFETIIKNLEKRNMQGFICETAEEAKELAINLIFDDAKERGVAVPKVGGGGSMTLGEIGLRDELDKLNAAGKIELLANPRGYTREAMDIKRQNFLADSFLMSTNAITMDGLLVNVDGLGNRVAGLIYGPHQVIVIAGYNKIAFNEEDAMVRVREKAAPPNCVRLSKNTPCSATGVCAECMNSKESICCFKVVTRLSNLPNRIKVILVNEVLGY